MPYMGIIVLHCLLHCVCPGQGLSRAFSPIEATVLKVNQSAKSDLPRFRTNLRFHSCSDYLQILLKHYMIIPAMVKYVF